MHRGAGAPRLAGPGARQGAIVGASSLCYDGRRAPGPMATWRSGYAPDCKSVDPGSIPGVASTFSCLRAVLAPESGPTGRGRSEGIEHMSSEISFGRGLFRLWLILTIVWWGVIGFLVYEAINDPIQRDALEWARFGALFLVPFGVLLAVRAIVWVIEGFRGGGR